MVSWPIYIYREREKYSLALLTAVINARRVYFELHIFGYTKAERVRKRRVVYLRARKRAKLIIIRYSYINDVMAKTFFLKNT